MPRTDHRYEILDGQTDFRGGMHQVGDATENQYSYSENTISRNGWIETRPGIKRTSRSFSESFYFNLDNSKDPTPPLSGFWFAWDWVALNFGTIQGSAFFRFLLDSNVRQVVVSNGDVFVFTHGFVSIIPTVEEIAENEKIEFIQANQELIMLRDEGLNPLKWDGSNAGFVRFGASALPDSPVPLSSTGTYAGGRLWLVKDRDDIYASDIFDTNTYEYVYQKFSAQKGDGDEITRLIPYHDDYLLIFKKTKVYAMSGVKFAANQTAFDTDGLLTTAKLSDSVTIKQVLNNFGLVAPKCVVVHGEQVTFLSYKGIASISRTTEGQLQGIDVTLSAPIQPTIDRINWSSVEGACAGTHDNYLFFAVPLDSSTVNNAVLVYDLETQSWVSIWDGELISPIEFFNDANRLVVLNSDGAFREWFTSDPWDSNTPIEDVSRYDSSKFYQVGSIVSSDEGVIYTAIRENENTALTETDTWIVVSDPENMNKISSKINTRFYKHNDEASPKRYSRTQIIMRSQNPEVSVEIKDREQGTTKSLFSNVTRNRLKYETDNKPNWDDSNVNLDIAVAGREDYTVFLDSVGMTIDSSGFTLNIYNTNDLRFKPNVSNNNEFSLTINNTQGKLRVISIISKAQQGQLGKRNI
tara:strand:- start:7093 stop:9006 length:1914 start_codon:yes stop_codon:yes gene_type:complete